MRFAADFNLFCVFPKKCCATSFVSNVLACLRKPSDDEALHGARILAIMALIQGADEERFFQRASNVLSPLAKASRNPVVKAAVRNDRFLSTENNWLTFGSRLVACCLLLRVSRACKRLR